MPKDRQSDITQQEYKGPNRIVTAGARGYLEARIAGIVSIFAGGAAGTFFHKPINRLIERSPGAAKFVDQGAKMIGADYFTKAFGTQPSQFKAAILGAFSAYLIVPWVAFINGTRNGLKTADEGRKQFEAAKQEIRSLRTELQMERQQNSHKPSAKAYLEDAALEEPKRENAKAKTIT